MGSTTGQLTYGEGVDAPLSMGDGELRALDKQLSTVEAVVTVLLPEFEQVEVETADGRALAITEQTLGVSWSSLKAGQKLLCRVRGMLTPQVVSASVLA